MLNMFRPRVNATVFVKRALPLKVGTRRSYATISNVPAAEKFTINGDRLWQVPLQM